MKSTRPQSVSSIFRNVSVAVLASACLLVVSFLASCGGAKREGQVTIRISPGTSTSEIARMLAEEDVIDSEKDFTNKANETGVGEKLKAGIYRFERGESIESIFEKLENGIQAPEGVLTVPEGYSITDVARLLSSRTEITEKEYRQAVKINARRLPLSGASQAEDLEGFLFPSTYDLNEDITANTLVDRQLETFQKKTSGLDWGKATGLGLSEYQLLIVASLVEREARVPEERPQVAAVIYNRLTAGMKLEVDATVQYAIGYWKRELTQQDLENDSPYNTRLYKGLPPGPICNPGIESIMAAMDPAPVDYIYYVATGDEEGHHFFTSSYDEFLRAKDGV
ncbi:MAG: endolytic transglycosylase MltG [Thermoleophilia bacterium]